MDDEHEDYRNALRTPFAMPNKIRSVELVRASFADYRRQFVPIVIGFVAIPRLLLKLSEHPIAFLTNELAARPTWAHWVATKLFTLGIWSSLFCGQLFFALELIRSGRARIQSLLLGIRFFPRGLPVVVVTVCLVKGSELAAAAIAMHVTGVVGSLVKVVGVVAGSYFFARTLSWLPTVIDLRLSPLAALKLGLGQTRDHVIEILLAVFALGVPMLLFALVVRTWPLVVQGVIALIAPVATFLVCRVYFALSADSVDRPAPSVTLT